MCIHRKEGIIISPEPKSPWKTTVNLQPWDNAANYDRFGLETEYQEIMGIEVPKVTIPVRAGRNLAIIIEIAAMNNREKRMGYNTAEEFNRQLLRQAGIDPDSL